MKISLANIDKKAKSRPAGYKEDLLKRGRIEGDFLFVTPDAYLELWTKYNGDSFSKGCCKSLPSASQMAHNALKAAGRLIKAGASGKPIIANPEAIQKRQEICASCEFLNGKRCTKCGCFTVLKTKLETEHCPAGKW